MQNSEPLQLLGFTSPHHDGNVRYARLAQLPAAIKFPASLGGRVWYEPGSGRLAFRGFMSKATFDQLERLPGDSAYQRAIEELFRQCIYESPSSAVKHYRRWLLTMVAVAATAALVTVSMLAVR